jgi:hypothetical protein
MRDSQRQQNLQVGDEDALDTMLAQDRKRRERPAMLPDRIRSRLAAWWRALGSYTGRRPF